MDHFNFLDRKTPFNDMMYMYYYMKQLDKGKEFYNEIEQRNISREYLWEECWLYGDDDEDEDEESQVIKQHHLCSTMENLGHVSGKESLLDWRVLVAS